MNTAAREGSAGERVAPLGSKADAARQDERWRLTFLRQLSKDVSAGDVFGATNLELVIPAEFSSARASAWPGSLQLAAFSPRASLPLPLPLRKL